MNDAIFEAVAASPGMAIGVPVEGLRRAWDSACRQVESLLLQRRSVIFPNFGHFIAQQHVEHSGTWGARSLWTPTFSLLPNFASAYGFRVPPTSVAHLGATTPILLNLTTVSVEAQLPRHATANALKDIVREIGNRALSGKSFSIDMVACTLQFGGARCTPTWSKTVTETLRHLSQRSQQSADNPQLSPRTILRLDSSLSGRPTTAPTSMNTGAKLSVVKEAAPAVSSRPPEEAAAPKASQFMLPAPPSQPKPLSTEHLAQTARVPSAPGGPRPPITTARMDQSPASREGIESIRRAVSELPEHLSPHAKHQFRKHLYRRMRSKAFEDSWEQSIHERERARQEEAQRDREKAQALREAIQAEKEAEREMLLQKKEEQRKIAEVNKALIGSRQQLPPSESSRDIFSARLRTYSAAHDVDALQEQIRDREDRKRQEQEADVQARRDMERDYASHCEKEKALQQQRRQERMRLMAEYESETRMRRDMAKTLKDTELRVERALPGLRFTEENTKNTVSDDIRKENIELITLRLKQAETQALRAAEKEKEDAANFAARDKMLRDQERFTKTVVQRTMRQTWEQQMNERKARKRAERENEKRWKGTVFLKNESSEDDES